METNDNFEQYNNTNHNDSNYLYRNLSQIDSSYIILFHIEQFKTNYGIYLITYTDLQQQKLTKKVTISKEIQFGRIKSYKYYKL